MMKNQKQKREDGSGEKLMMIHPVVIKHMILTLIGKQITDYTRQKSLVNQKPPVSSYKVMKNTFS